MRLDLFLVRRGFVESREKARRAIRSGAVRVAGAVVSKPSFRIPPSATVEVASSPEEEFVSRGGIKLAAALDAFGVDPKGWSCLDIGASTGGFTDCLLRRGASRVYAVDVGHGQLAPRLESDSRVVSWEGINARHLPAELIPEPCRLIVLDLSFISLAKVIPAVLPALAEEGLVLPLIKPQFEAGPGGVGKGGVLRDEGLRRTVLRRTVEEIEALGLVCLAFLDCPVPGGDGNREALALFARRGNSGTVIQLTAKTSTGPAEESAP